MEEGNAPTLERKEAQMQAILPILEFIQSILTKPAWIMGLFAFVGLVALKRPAHKVMTGTLKPILGYIMLSAGAAVVQENLAPLGTFIETGFHITGVVPNNEVVVSMAQSVLGVQTMMILILGYVSPSQYGDLVEYDITQTIDSYAQALALEKEAARQNRKAKAHLAVDTGMTRIGFQVTEHDADEAAKIADLPHIELEGMFTHFSCADQEDKTYCSMQMEKYDKMTALLAERGVTIPLRHICNSAGIMEFDDHRFEMVRSGIITYGIYPSEEVKKERLDLIPALSWKSHVIHVKEVGPGIGVSYGATYVTEKPMTRIATVSAGYADGYPRALSNQGCVLIHGKKAPIIGRICMDQMMVDVTDIPDVQVEDVVTLVGTDGDETITIEEIANPAARFDYEMLCDISSRVTRVYK